MSVRAVASTCAGPRASLQYALALLYLINPPYSSALSAQNASAEKSIKDYLAYHGGSKKSVS